MIHQISPLTGTLIEIDSKVHISNAGGPLENALVDVSQGEVARFSSVFPQASNPIQRTFCPVAFVSPLDRVKGTEYQAKPANFAMHRDSSHLEAWEFHLENIGGGLFIIKCSLAMDEERGGY